LVYVYYNLRLWVKQLEIKIDAKAISLDEIDTTAAWRVEVEEPVTETALDWLEDSGDDHGISEDLDQDVSEDIQFHADIQCHTPPLVLTLLHTPLSFTPFRAYPTPFLLTIDNIQYPSLTVQRKWLPTITKNTPKQQGTIYNLR
jgi:hypothetical protein